MADSFDALLQNIIFLYDSIYVDSGHSGLLLLLLGL